MIVLNNLYYDYNKSSLRPGAANELDVVYGRSHEEISDHGDRAGSRIPIAGAARNTTSDCRNPGPLPPELSGQPGHPARTDHRRRVWGDPAAQPLQRRVTCTEAEHEYNRRTEILITTLDEPVEIRYEEEK